MKKFRKTISFLCLIILVMTVFTACDRSPKFKISLDSIKNGTVEVSTTKAKSGTIIVVNAKPNVGFKLKPLSLKFNGVLIPGNNFIMPSQDVKITAEFEYIKENERLVSVAETKNGKIELEKEYFAEGEVVYMYIIPSDGYRLKTDTLKYNGNSVVGDMSFAMPFENVLITAEFEKLPSGYGSVSVQKTVNGRVLADTTSAQRGTPINVKVVADEGYQIVLGSLKYNGVEISQNSFIMPNEKKVIITVEFIKTEYKRINERGEEDKNGKYMLFGYYPKTLKLSSVKVSDKAENDGYYLGSDGAKYAKYKTALTHSDVYYFSDKKTSVINHVIYYFKVEPIKWRILSEENGKALLLCEDLIDTEVFLNKANFNADGYNIKKGVSTKTPANNWKYSDLKDYMNDTLYNKIFGETQKYFIADTIDNDLSTKVTLPSSEDMLNRKYGFGSEITAADKARIKFATDYARAKGVKLNIANDLVYGSAQYWLKSGSKTDIKNVFAITDYGSLTTAGTVVSMEWKGLAPIITLKFD